MEHLNFKEVCLVEMDAQDLISVNGGWIGLGREILRSILMRELWKEAKKAGKAWVDFIQDNAHLFPDGPPANTGAPY